MGTKELTTRQKRFVREYLLCGNAAEAAECAGYAPVKAAETGEKLLAMPAVQKYRREQEQKLFDDMGICHNGSRYRASPMWANRGRGRITVRKDRSSWMRTSKGRKERPGRS